jgi:lipopolysaccharide export system permease protein
MLLYTYLATEMLAPFFASLAVLTTVLFMGQMVPFLETIFDLRIGLADFVRICAYLIPNLLLFAIPMASMMAVIIAFTRLTADNEILAMKAGGIGLCKMCTPVMAFALGTALLTAFASTHLIPAGTVATKKLLFQLAKEKIDRGLQERRFSEGIRDVVLYIDHIDRNSGQWQGVYLADLRDLETPITIFAKTGNLKVDLPSMRLTLALKDGTLHRSAGEATQTIRFGGYSINLPLQTPQFVAGESASQVGRKGMDQTTLLREAARLGPETPTGRSYLIEFHRRFSLPLGCLLLTLMGLPMAIRSRPGHRPLGLPLGLITFILYYVLFTAGQSLADSGTVPVLPAMWAPNLLFALFTIVLLRSAARETTGRWIDRLMDWAFAIGRMLLPSSKERPSS